MSDVVEQKIVSMLDALQTGAVSVAGQVVKYTPDVVQAVESVVMLDGIQSVIIGLLMIAFIYASIKLGLKLVDESEGNSVVLAAIFVIPAVVTIFYTILNVWTWAAIFSPKLYIAHKIIEGVIK